MNIFNSRFNLRFQRSFLSTSKSQQQIDCFLRFLDSSPEPFHVVKNISTLLQGIGFQSITEEQHWNKILKPNGNYFFTRGDTSIVAFTVGKHFVAGNPFRIIGAHTDSPCLKLKPVSKVSGNSSLFPISQTSLRYQSDRNHGFIQLNVECYGGGIWSTWMDRDLSLAGRVILRRIDPNQKANYIQRLVHIKEPILKIPNLCIHLRSTDEKENLSINKETHLKPILSSYLNNTLSSSQISHRHCPELLSLLESELEKSNISRKDYEIVDFDLSLFDSQPASLLGPVYDEREQFDENSPPITSSFSPSSVHDSTPPPTTTTPTPRPSLPSSYPSFLSSARLDNLTSCHLAVHSLIDSLSSSSSTDSDSDCSTVRMIALFDHEEVGSGSMQGAGSNLMAQSVHRIASCFPPASSSSTSSSSTSSHSDLEEAINIGKSKSIICISTSFILSADMAHAIHPNHLSRHDPAHAPLLNRGPVMKMNNNQRYATSGESAFLMRELARHVGVNIQEFSVKNDCPCGSTIGPVLSQQTGMRAVDFGLPQLSMHSIRETMGTRDLIQGQTLFNAFFTKEFDELDERFRRRDRSIIDSEIGKGIGGIGGCSHQHH